MRMFAVLCGTACLLSVGVAAAEKQARSDQVQVTGTRVSEAEMADSDPVALVGKRGIMAVLSDGLDSYCAEDSLAAEHVSNEGYRIADEALDVEALIARAQAEGDSLRCLRITGDRPGRSDVRLLEANLVNGLGTTILFPVSQ